MKDPVKSDNIRSDSPGTSFPTHFIDPQVKKGTKWCLQYVKAFHDEAAFLPTDNSLSRNNQNYTRMRKYARGEQSENQYKELMGLKKDKGALNTSFRNLNFEILKIAPKLRNVLINKVLNNPYRIQVKPIDQTGMNERRKQKSKMAEFIVSQKQIEQFETITKMGLEKPVGPGEIPPSSMREVEPWLDMNPKNSMSMEVKDYLSYSLAFNDWKEIGREICGDLVDCGIGGTIQFVDAHGNVRFERVIPERAIANRCIFPDFRDLIRFGHYSEITVAELKRQTKGSFGEDEYRKIANQVAGEQSKYTNPSEKYWNEQNYTYAYDKEKITILKAFWYSTDTAVTKEYQNEFGNTRTKKMDFNYKPFKGDMAVNEGKGVSDEEYSEMSGGKKKIYRNQSKNVYRATWVCGTDYIFDHGLLPNMARSVSNIGETQMPVSLYSTDFISTMSLIEQPLDQAQINWLQFQSHTAASKPPGIAIEKKALARVAGTGKGGKRLDPKEDLIMYAEIGSIVYDGYDQHNNPLPYLPIKELTNGLSPAAGEHFALIIQMIDMMRNILGLNALTEGQTPPERMGKQVAQMAWGASDNALSHLNDAFRNIYERTCKNVVGLMQSTLSNDEQEEFSEALGFESYEYFNLNRDLSLREMGITIEEGPDDEIRAKISVIVQKAIDNKEIDPEDGIYIELEDNLYRAIQMLKKSRLEREARLQAGEERKITLAAEEQQKGAVAVQEAQKAAKTEMLDKEKEMKVLESQLRQQEEDKKFLQSLVIKKLEREEKLDDSDNDFVKEVMKIVLQGQTDVKTAKATPKPKTVAA